MARLFPPRYPVRAGEPNAVRCSASKTGITPHATVQARVALDGWSSKSGPQGGGGGVGGEGAARRWRGTGPGSAGGGGARRPRAGGGRRAALRAQAQRQIRQRGAGAGLQDHAPPQIEGIRHPTRCPCAGRPTDFNQGAPFDRSGIVAKRENQESWNMIRVSLRTS
jgi:hypothetical protein